MCLLPLMLLCIGRSAELLRLGSDLYTYGRLVLPGRPVSLVDRVLALDMGECQAGSEGCMEERSL